MFIKKNRLHEISAKLRLHFETLQKNYHVRRIGVFGSFAHGEQKAKSDIDVLISFSEPIGLFHFIHTGDYLKRILKRKVDMVTPGALKPEIKRTVLREVRYI